MASLREMMRDFTPRRFADALPDSTSFGWRTLWAMGLVPDAYVEWAVQGAKAFLPGKGTPTALPMIAAARGIVRGRSEAVGDHVARLVDWLSLHEQRGTMRGMTREIQNYLGKTNAGESFRVMCVSRRGTWGIREPDGSYSYLDPGDAAYQWNWDGNSHPERGELWAEMWIIIAPSSYSNHLAWFWTSPDSALGHDAPQAEVTKLRQIVSDWKAARTRVRTMIFVPTPLDLDPIEGPPGEFPNGTWGKYSKLQGGRSVPSRPKTFRFWDF